MMNKNRRSQADILVFSLVLSYGMINPKKLIVEFILKYRLRYIYPRTNRFACCCSTDCHMGQPPVEPKLSHPRSPRPIPPQHINDTTNRDGDIFFEPLAYAGLRVHLRLNSLPPILSLYALECQSLLRLPAAELIRYQLRHLNSSSCDHQESSSRELSS